MTCQADAPIRGRGRGRHIIIGVEASFEVILNLKYLLPIQEIFLWILGRVVVDQTLLH